ncbi:MAG: VCBS domain-containing protein, partial [Thermodesulfobacteriota bacterium]
TINGTEDTPVLGGTITGTVAEDGTLSTNGTLTITDVDTSDNPVSFNDEAATAGNNGYGTFEITGNTWTYNLNNGHASVQALDVGESLSDTYTFTASDGSTQTVTVTIDGAEDAPVLGGTITGTVAEEGTLSTNGTLTISDVDTSDNPINFPDVAATAGDNGYGTFEITGNTWTYNLNNNHAFVQALDVGESLSDTYTFTASDGSTQTVTVTIDGAEDAPVLGGVILGTVTEDGALSTNGTLTISDVDTSDNPVSFNDEAATAGDNGYGTFEITGNTWTYNLNNSHASVQALDVGESLSDTYTFTASDGSTQSVTVTIDGAEDAPVLGGTITGSVAEDGTLSTNGTLTITDVDTSDNPVSFNDEAATAGDNGYGTFEITGNTWTYNLNNGHASVQALGAGGSLNDTYTFTASDGSTQTVTVTIDGANDNPTDISLSVYDVDENTSTGTVIATLSATDIDTIDSYSYALVAGDGTNDADNGLVTIVGNELRVNGSIDFETNPNLEINVQVTDSGSLSYTEALTVTVNDVDEISPTVVDVVASHDPVTEANVGSGTFSIVIDFNEPMDTNFPPTLTFSEAIEGSSITNASGAWSNSDQTYTVTYDVIDDNVDLTDVTVDVTGAQDVNGNVQLDYTPLREFDIDTVAPDAPDVDLLASSDSNTDDDDITNNTTPTIRINLNGTGSSAPVVGDVVRLYDGVTQVGIATLIAGDITNDYVDITTSILGDGPRDLTATITDDNGNTSSASGVLAVTIDTLVAAPVVTLDTDGGNNFLDTYTVSGTETGATLQYSTDSNDGLDGSWGPFPDPPGTDVNGAGDYSFYVRQIDVAGNISAGTLLEFTNGDDLLDDTLTAGVSGVHDIIAGGDGNDTLNGNASDNTLYGDGGDDHITGGAGINTLYGGDGDDTFYGGSGDDAMDGGAHSVNGDTVDYSSDTTGVTVSLVSGLGSGGDATGDTYFNIDNLIGGTGIDFLTGDGNDNVLRGGGNTDTITGGAGTNTLYGGADSDTFIGGAGDDAFYGDNDETHGNDTDVDTVSYASDGAGVSASLTTGSGSAGVASGDSYSDIENLTGGSGGDTLEGDGEINILTGGAGTDTLIGMAGNDTLYGGAGIDDLQGGDGDDILEGGAGGDHYSGGNGSDTVSFAGSLAPVFVSLADSGFRFNDAFGDTYDADIENLTGTSQGDYMYGNDNPNILDGGAGADNLYGLGGNDTLIVDQADTTVDGGAGTDTVKINGLISTTYDLTNLAGNATSVETLDISGSTDTTIQVTAADIQAMVDAGAGSSLIIIADADDKLVLESGTFDVAPPDPITSGTYSIDSGAAFIEWTIV